MSKKITKIKFYNYKAFYCPNIEDIYTIDLKDGLNLLVYGENGSGKSSLYTGLYDFFLSSSNKNLEFNQNVFSEGNIPAQPEPYIAVNFKDDPAFYIFSKDGYSTNTHSFNYIKETNTAKSFLSYKDLLKIHFYDEKQNINLFDLLVGKNGIIRNIKNPSGVMANSSEGTFGDLWNDIVAKSRSRRNSYEYKDLLNTGLIADFNTGLNTFLNLLCSDIQQMLKYFDKSLILEGFQYTDLMINDVDDPLKRLINYKVYPIIKYYEKIRDDYSIILNEARLTAFALSIYFASLIKIPAPSYKILFLDDIFLGLDTNNRIPLLRILKDYFLNDYQIIITTYDRYWFEIAKDQLGKDNWQTIEMFIKENTRDFRPVIIQPSSDYYELAKKYIDANDYPACGNYQRKACEKLIKDFIPFNLQLQENNDGTTSVVNLETLFTNLIKYLKINNLDSTPFANYALFKRLILNTLSHDDLKSPYYKSELEEMFSILEELRKLKREVILNTGDFIYFETSGSDGQPITFDIKAEDNFVLLKQGHTKKYQKCKFRTINKHTNGSREDFNELGELHEIYKNICQFLGIQPVADIYSLFKDKDGKKLSDF